MNSLPFQRNRPHSRTGLLLAIAAALIIQPVALAKSPREAEVLKADNVWETRVEDRAVYTGPNLIEAIQAAADGLTPDRDWKETVHVRVSGTVSADNSDLVAIQVPSYTVLDFHGNTIRVQGPHDNVIIPIRAQEVKEIEVRNLGITGNPRFAIFMKACEDVLLSNIRMVLGTGDDRETWGGAGLRTEGGDRPWSGAHNRNFVLEDIYVERTRGHGVEFWRTDGLQIDTLTTRHTGGCGILLNQTLNAKIGLVDAYRANHGGGYAGFRVANNGGPNIEVDKVIAVECGRGVFTVSGSHGITIHEVDIARSTGHGMLIEDTENFVVNGGTIVDTGAEGVRINSRRLGQGPGDDHHPSSNVTIQNLRISGCPWGIRETLPRTNNNRILNNDLRGNRNCLEHQGEGTVAEGNTCD